MNTDSPRTFSHLKVKIASGAARTCVTIAFDYGTCFHKYELDNESWWQNDKCITSI